MLNLGTSLIDEITAVIGGYEFRGWSGLTVTEAIDNLAGGFSFECTSDADVSILRNTLRPFGYQPVQIFVGLQPLMMGEVDEVSPSIDAGSKKIALQGRSLTSRLLDCTVDIGAYMNGVSFADLCSACCLKVGIGFLPTPGIGAEIVRDSRPEPAETYFEYLKKHADAFGYILTDTILGQMTISSKPSIGVPVAEIFEGVGGFAGGSATYSGQSRFGSYKVLAQKAATNRFGISLDPAIPPYRAVTIVESESLPGGAQAAADYQRALAFSRTSSVSITMAGWTNLTGPWRAGDTVILSAPSLYILEPTAFLVAEVSFKLTESNKSTDLRLVLPETYSLTMPLTFPWIGAI